MIKPLYGLSKIVVFMVTFLFTASAFAEYYIVYPGSYASSCYEPSPCKVYKKKYKKYKKIHHKAHKVYKKRSGGCMVKYRVYPTCSDAYLVPSCRYAWGSPPPAPPCRSGCNDFNVPSEYFYRSNYYDSYYYDPAMDWDMRTRDDY